MEKQNELKELKAVKTKALEDGKYSGTIINYFRDTEHYDYMRYKINVDEHDITLECSYPTTVTFLGDGTPSSSHAKFLNRMGLNSFDEETNLIDFIEKNVLEKEVIFLITQKTTDKGTFSNIVKDSLKPKVK